MFILLLRCALFALSSCVLTLLLTAFSGDFRRAAQQG
jgi:hypothetical protein